MNIFLSKDYRDINFAKRIGIPNSKIKVIPNGASEKEFKRKYKYDFRKAYNLSRDNILITTIGSHTGSKGHREAIRIFKQANIKNSALTIIGNSFGGGCTAYCKKQALVSKFNFLNRNKIIIPELSREETVATLNQSDAFLFTSNIECSPIVLFEACAAGVPFLTADVGNSKEIIKWTSGGVVLPTSKDKCGFSHVDISKSVKILRKLVFNKKAMQKMRTNGYNSWKRKYTWEKISQDYEKMYRSLLK